MADDRAPEPVSRRQRWRLALVSAAAALVLVLTGLFLLGRAGYLEPPPQAYRAARSMLRSGAYKGREESYFTSRFGVPASSYGLKDGATNVCWSIDESDWDPTFLTVTFDAQGVAIDASIHGW